MLNSSIPAPATNVATMSDDEVGRGAEHHERQADQRAAEHPDQQRPAERRGAAAPRS